MLQVGNDLTLVPSKSLKVLRITSTSPAEIVQLAHDRIKEYTTRVEQREKAEQTVTQNNRSLELMKKREFKTAGVGIEKRQEAYLNLKGKIVVPFQCNAILKEVMKNSHMRNYITTLILKTTLSSPVEYIFLAELVTRLRNSIRQKEGYPDTVVQVDGVVERQSKRLEEFLLEKKTFMSTKAVKGDQYQADIKAKLKMISMIGGQVYKKITEKRKNIAK